VKEKREREKEKRGRLIYSSPRRRGQRSTELHPPVSLKQPSTVELQVKSGVVCSKEEEGRGWRVH
jgi:hypothetical protein